MVTDKLGIVKHFEELEDPRSRCEHDFLEIIIITICAVMCGMFEWEEIALFAEYKEDWLKKTLGLNLNAGIPSVHTFRRVISAIKAEAFQQCFDNWVKSIYKKKAGEVIALDGKTSRGTYDDSKDQDPLHLVNVVACSQGISLSQQAVDRKSNEITAIPILLERLDIKDTVITTDAMGCQKEIAKLIIKKKADYVLALKGNQGLFFKHVENHLEKIFNLEDRSGIEHSYYEAATELGHGRIETRKCLVLPVNVKDKEYDSVIDWKGIQSVALVESIRIDKQTGKTSMERRFYVSSLPADAKEILRCSREHWKVESFHWSLDLSFREDDSRIRTEEAPHNLSAIRKIAFNYLKLEKTCKKSMKYKQRKAFIDDIYRDLVLGLNLS